MENHCRQFKESIIHINAFSREQVFWSESGVKFSQIKPRLQDKTVQNISKQICGWIWMWETTGDGLFHWKNCVIMDYGLPKLYKMVWR